jgi:uncharacterized membrane protein (UPF0182 family)
VTFLTALAGVALLFSPVRDRIHAALQRHGIMSENKGLALLGSAAAFTFSSWLLLLFAVPALMQWLRVVPNEISLERPYIAHNIRFTHGYGIALNPVNEFTSEGLPRLLVKDIPPRIAYPELEVSRPQIYYGELTRTPVVVNSREAELDYPSGDKNEYIRYPGKGGVEIPNLWRKFLFGLGRQCVCGPSEGGPRGCDRGASAAMIIWTLWDRSALTRHPKRSQISSRR